MAEDVRGRLVEQNLHEDQEAEAEALLRIPDTATRDALIRDRVGGGDWRAHLGRSPSLFVNAATWGLVVTGRLTVAGSEASLGAALTRLIARAGEPVIRRGMDLAMPMLGGQFVAGRTTEEALDKGRRMEARGFRHSYGMLGEAAMTAADAERYFRDYERAIHAIGHAAAGRGIQEEPGISVKLSALHPRYCRAQRDRVMAELLPRLHSLAILARRYDIGLNIDAGEADRLDLPLDLLEALCLAPELQGWDSIGFVVQAYGKRAPFVLDWIIDLARRSGHRIMLRLVKGAYWDSEIKRAQLDGQEDFPVFTRKLHTDASYLACARKLLDAPDAVFPQFATHNARSLAAIHVMAGPVADPVAEARALCLPGRPHDGIALPRDLFGKARTNSKGLDLSDESRLAALVGALGAGSRQPLHAAPLLATDEAEGERREIRNPADRRELVGHVIEATPATVEAALAAAAAAAPAWAATAPAGRAAILERAADLMEFRMPEFLGPVIREAGKSLPNAIGEVREAVDFLRYYAAGVRDGFGNEPHRPLSVVACISPWNFPLAIFTGQVAAALAAGNAVLAKPAEETPLVVALAVRLLREAGALQLLPGDGRVGAALIADARCRA